MLHRATVFVVAHRARAIRRRNAERAATGGRADEDVHPRLAIPGGAIFLGDRRDRDRQRRSRPAIVIRVIAAAVAISGRPQENRAFSTASIRHRIEHRRLAERSRAAGAIRAVVRPPTVAFDVNEIAFEGERIGLICVRRRRCDQFQPDERRERCHAADTESIVAPSGRNTGAGRAVEVIRARRRIIIESIEVAIVHQIDIGREIRVRDLQPIIHDGDAHAAALPRIPHIDHVHV